MREAETLMSTYYSRYVESRGKQIKQQRIKEAMENLIEARKIVDAIEKGEISYSKKAFNDLEDMETAYIKAGGKLSDLF